MVYRPPKQELWNGRRDGPGAERYHERIRCYDLNKKETPLAQGSVALIGFVCDEGVRRNQGRSGAKEGPEAFRKAFGPLPVYLNEDIALYDVGDIACVDQDLEGAQDDLAGVVRFLLEGGVTPIVIGGGHELSWGQYLGFAQAFPGRSCRIVNFDAHYDIRPLNNGSGSSGTPFRQIYDHCMEKGVEFHYSCIGVQEFGNTKQLHAAAMEMGVEAIFSTNIHDLGNGAVETAISSGDPIYLSLCLDVFAASDAPGVSAPQPLGVEPWHLLPLMEQSIASKNVVMVGIAELSPPFDCDDRTAKLSAQILSRLLARF